MKTAHDQISGRQTQLTTEQGRSGLLSTTQKRSLVIVGAGEFAKIADEYFTKDSDYHVVAFAVESTFKTAETVNDKPLVAIEDLTVLFPPDNFSVHIAITYTELNTVRERIFKKLKSLGYKFANYISSNAFVWDNVEIGENVFIFEANVVQPFCTIGDCVVLWSGNHIGHRTQIKSGVYVSSHVVISGYCQIGERCFIGVNTAFADHVTIAEDNFVAMASVVTTNMLDPDRVIKGSPATATKISAKRLMKARP
ncbi:acetyltransferase [Methylobacterium sp. J-030]|uniref:acetyltransferase n=1 Tax=Methylobacterium sp. J-030 TaxID=2836627 RepID=UPI001FB9EE9D|nr:acetyltransferase [Methylobacterium sp. J-030]MCJ2071059.1 acetyltransferase [Methylobacterium sp. J-030]